MTDKPDYTTMSGAEFKRAVGADQHKWAEAFEQQSQRSITGDEAWLRTHEQRVEYLASWFRDAMSAATTQYERQHGYALNVAMKGVRGLIPDAEWEKVKAAIEAAIKAGSE